MIDPRALVGALTEAGWTEYSGVPCSILDPIRAEADRGDSTRYLPASVEGEAVAFGAGLWLGGKSAIVLMQNSGLGNTVNPLASLLLPYRIPVLLIVSWRGQPGTADAVHHAPMGLITPSLLGLLSIPYWVLDGSLDANTIVAAALLAIKRSRTPAALLVPRGVVGAGPPRQVAQLTDLPVAISRAEAHPTFASVRPLDRSQLVDAVLRHFPDDPIVSTTGYMSRDLAAKGPQDHHFYMQGSMGFAAAIALGVAQAHPGRRILVLDGDGALLMRLGTLATVGHAAPPGLVHIVADNRCYASTGGQKTVAATTSFPRVARGCGYRRVATCAGADGLEDALRWAVREPGPTLLHVEISADDSAGRERPIRSPEEIAEAFRNHVGAPLAS